MFYCKTLLTNDQNRKDNFCSKCIFPPFLMPNYSLELDFMPIWGLEYKYMLTN